MISAGRSLVAPDALHLHLHQLGVAELLRRYDRVVPHTKVLGVVGDVQAALSLSAKQ